VGASGAARVTRTLGDTYVVDSGSSRVEKFGKR
jgi:hypothetical protein